MLPSDLTQLHLIQLEERLAAFALDDDTAALPFSRRLAHENTWCIAFARRVILEYKRFALLAVGAGHPVTPSDAVDQAWHLHLTYTRSYWDHFCPEVLGGPLHHGPTRGGADEQRRFVRDYERTLASYERIFGEPPPADIWPPAAWRFGRDLEHVRLRRTDYWMLRKPLRLTAALHTIRKALGQSAHERATPRQKTPEIGPVAVAGSTADPRLAGQVALFGPAVLLGTEPPALAALQANVGQDDGMRARYRDAGWGGGCGGSSGASAGGGGCTSAGCGSGGCGGGCGGGGCGGCGGCGG